LVVVEEAEEEEEEEEGKTTEGQHRWHADNDDTTPLSTSLARLKKAAATLTMQRLPAMMTTIMKTPSEAATILLNFFGNILFKPLT
jgi:hypothetical protein